MAEGKYKAQTKWTKNNSRLYAIRVYKTSEKDMIDWIDNHKPVNSYIKGLIRKDMESK